MLNGKPGNSQQKHFKSIYIYLYHRATMHANDKSANLISHILNINQHMHIYFS